MTFVFNVYILFLCKDMHIKITKKFFFFCFENENTIKKKNSSIRYNNIILNNKYKIINNTLPIQHPTTNYKAMSLEDGVDEKFFKRNKILLVLKF